MVTSHCEQSHVLAISECSCSARLSDAQRIDAVNPWRRSHTDDFFPLEPVVPVDLRPGHLADLVQGVQGCMSLWLLQSEQICLKCRVVQVKQDLVNGLTRHRGPTA